MKLKSLEVQGFKTFPDKTKLNFTNGITAVVGPNGSGKSNISDAIRWVLGEQSAKSLRCSKMEDVIFNGTQQRKKAGYAQVVLSIDNSDRTLQFDGDEVSVTRRFYRSGNSEYLINNTAVRLQDIHELFMDTGLGRDGYSMIGQGKIDAIVSTKSEDRREIFEEAAGISRFRYKKADAERRLDKTEENLVRLRDIISELEGRVEPLRIQSEKAKSYLEYAEEKRGLEIALWLKTLDKSALQIREQEDKISVAKIEYDEVEKALKSIQDESEEVFSKQNELTAQSEQARQETSAYERESAEKRSRVSVLENDILHNEKTVERIQADTVLMEQSEEFINDEIAGKEKFIEESRSKLESKKTEFEKYAKKLESLRAEESRSAEKLDEINAVLSELTQSSSEAKIQYRTSASSTDELTARKGIAENTVKARLSQIETLKSIISDYESMLKDCEQRGREVSERLSDEEKAVTEQRKKCDGLKAESDKLTLDGEQLFRKAKMLEDLERNLEGFTHSVKTVMREAKKGNLTGIHAPVSRVIKTSSEYSTAIETALGASMQNIVTTDEKSAKQAIAYLKKCDGGRATFLPMSSIRGRELNESGLENCKGFIGTASALCSCEECYSEILSNLLGRTAVAENLDYAAEIAKKYSYRFRIVTLDGQVINVGGSLTGGSLTKSTGLLGRASEIEKIRSKAEKTAENAENAKKRLNREQHTLEEMTSELEKTRQELSRISEDKIKITAEMKSRKAELDSTSELLKGIRAELEESVRKLSELSEIMKKARSDYEVYDKRIKENEELLGILSGARNDYISRRESISEKLQEIRLETVTIERDISSALAEIENARLRFGSSAEKIRKNNDEINAIVSRNAEIREEIETLKQQAEELSEKAKTARQQTEELSYERMSLEKRTTELRKSEREKISEKERVGGEVARLEERRLNLQKQYDEIISKLWEEYELTKREAENTAVRIDEVGKAQRRLSELKQKIRSLGSVNVSAIDEYKEVKERYEFLKAQTGDVEKSKSELLKLINELTKQMKEIFLERFRLINENFSSTFVELFGGGKASLSLSDTENVLTSGIEISVEPPGKIVSHIELLSGGEKALVAIALYFAIMKVSPAPFCVMDEIEAALDDVNVYRFASYLRRMNDNTQFICITHRRGTMEEADVLYGVTMQDRGISKLLELHTSEIEQKLGLKD